MRYNFDTKAANTIVLEDWNPLMDNPGVTERQWRLKYMNKSEKLYVTLSQHFSGRNIQGHKDEIPEPAS